MSFSCKKEEFDRCFNRLDRRGEELRSDRFPTLIHTASKSAKCDYNGNGVKVAILLLQNRKNCPAAGAGPRSQSLNI